MNSGLSAKTAAFCFQCVRLPNIRKEGKRQEMEEKFRLLFGNFLFFDSGGIDTRRVKA